MMRTMRTMVGLVVAGLLFAGIANAQINGITVTSPLTITNPPNQPDHVTISCTGCGGGSITAGKGIAVNGSTVSTSGVPTNIINWQTDVSPAPTCDGVYYFNGSMANGSGTLVDTVDNPFSAGSVGKTVQVDNAGSANAPATGTITGFTDSGHVTTSITSARATGTVMFAFGTDNTTSVNALSTKMALAPAYVNLGTCNAVVTANAHLIIPPYLNTIVQGAGGGTLTLAPSPGTGNGNVLATAQPATMFMTLTTSMTGAFIQAVNGANVGTYETSSALRDFSVMGAVGFSAADQVGGSSTSDCVDMINWNGLELDNIGCWNFGRHGFYGDVATSGNIANNLDVITFNHTSSQNNGGAGYRIGGVAAGGALMNFQIQDINFLNNTVAQGNKLAGYSIASDTAGLVIRDSFGQNDGNGAGFPNVQAEIEVNNPSTGIIEGNYLEVHGTNLNQLNGIAIREPVSPAATMINGLLISGNFVISDVASGTFDDIIVGYDGTHTAGGVTVSNNYMGYFNGPATNACLEIHKDSSPVTSSNNYCLTAAAYE